MGILLEIVVREAIHTGSGAKNKSLQAHYTMDRHAQISNRLKQAHTLCYTHGPAQQYYMPDGCIIYMYLAKVRRLRVTVDGCQAVGLLRWQVQGL